MIEIKDLLSGYQDILFGEGIKKEIICSVFKEVLNINISTNDIEVKNGTLYLNIKPIYKNEIFIKKNEILNKLEASLGSKSPTQIF